MAKIGPAALQKINRQLFNRARRFIPGGVNSPVRSFKPVGGPPVFIEKGRGPKVYGREKAFIDYCLSWGALILGHSHPEVTRAVERAVKKGTSFGAVTRQETELARLITEAVFSVERVRLTNSGTEAVMGAVRLARAYTGRRKIIKFAGSYHGHADYLLVKAGSGAAALGIPDSMGVPRDFTKHTIVLPFNNAKRLERAAERYKRDLAAIIIEPVMANCGVILPVENFLQAVRAIADRYEAVLIFDEVITGFRVSYGGAEGFFGVRPDLICLGKVIGGGLPVGAFAGRREIMELLAPSGGVYQAGTLSGNPVAVAAGVATLNILKRSNPYSALQEKTEILCRHTKERADRSGIKIRINRIGSIFSIFFTDRDVSDYATAKTQNPMFFKSFYHTLLKEGIYFSPSGFESNFLSTAHDYNGIKKTLRAIDKALKKLRR